MFITKNPIANILFAGAKPIKFDIVEHEITALDFMVGSFQLTWNKATANKIISMTGTIYDTTLFKAYSMNGNYEGEFWLMGTDLTANDSMGVWQETWIAKILIIYEA